MQPTTAALLEQPPLFQAPSSAAGWPAWRERLTAWRSQARQALDYDGALYDDEAFRWASSAYACGFVFMYDSTFYDKAARRYTVDALLDRAIESFGGYDAVVLWHAYPRIGFDPRNQFDFYRDMPGGLAGLRQACREFQARGVRVFLNYNPWDTGTRRETRSDAGLLAEMMQALDADGLFLDTMTRGARELRARLEAVRPGVVLESEGALPLANVHDHHMSWAQNFDDSPAPGVLRNKWFEPRHMQHLICRWKHDHTAELHTAWMNGCGLIVWENVFGTWVGWNARDRALLRSLLPIQRRYQRLFSAGQWTPLVETQTPGVYASQWEYGGLRLWTLVNRGENTARGGLLDVPHVDQTQYFDLIAGQALAPALADGVARLAGEIGPRGIGALLAGPPAALGQDLPAFLDRQAALRPRASNDTLFPARATVRQTVVQTARVAATAVPADMVAIPGATLELETEFRVRECGFYDPAEAELFEAPYLHTFKTFQQRITLSPFAVDLTPVTNAQYAEFLAATGYRPEVTEKFLSHWHGARPPKGLQDHPVVYVDLIDARAYAAWAGKRLPAEAEWQYAAEGIEHRRYPWGDKLVPGAYNDGSRGGTTPVTAHPGGRSLFGCYDMCGNVWQWTESERSDGRTRFCIVRGGAYFKAEGSDWYADGGPVACNFAAKFLLLWPGTDRCATVGFRCVRDLA
jgi:formylglycine-generating enzyme required for sulfatase activity